jgi:hypothetical protein
METSTPKPRDRNRLASLLFQPPLGFFVLGSLTLLAAAFFLTGIEPEALVFWFAGQARLWHLLMIAQPVLSATALLAVAGDFRNPHSVWPETRRERAVVVLCTALACAMNGSPFAAYALTRRSFLLPADMVTLLHVPDPEAKFPVLGLTHAVSVSLLTAGMFCVHVQLLQRLREYRARGEAAGPDGWDEDLSWFQRRRSQLARLLVFSSALIGTATLSIGALRNLLNEARPFTPELIPASVVLMYGAYFTGILASVYLPTRRTLTEVGQVLADQLLRQSPRARMGWTDWTQERHAIRDHLGLQHTVLEDLLHGIAVLSPFVASVSSVLLG